MLRSPRRGDLGGAPGWPGCCVCAPACALGEPGWLTGGVRRSLFSGRFQLLLTEGPGGAGGFPAELLLLEPAVCEWGRVAAGGGGGEEEEDEEPWLAPPLPLAAAPSPLSGPPGGAAFALLVGELGESFPEPAIKFCCRPAMRLCLCGCLRLLCAWESAAFDIF